MLLGGEVHQTLEAVEAMNTHDPAGSARRIAACALASAVLCASGAHADTPADDAGPSDWYVALSGFHVMPRDSDTTRPTDFGRLTGEAEYGSSPAFSAAIGRHVMEAVRLEFEVGYSPVDIKAMTSLRVGGHLVDLPYGLTGDSDVWTVTMAVAYDVPTQGPLRPYIGAGVGIAHHETRTTFTLAGIDPVTEAGDDTVLSYHLRAGLSYQLSDTVVVFGGYRYIGARDVEIVGARSTSKSDALETGARVRF